MDKKVIKIAKLYAQKVRSYMPVSMVVLYGSHVRGTAPKMNSKIKMQNAKLRKSAMT
jgi:predicted nucleotidyltransferase